MKQAEEAVLHTYNRYPVVLDHGEGVYLYDTEGKKYLDFAAGIAVQALGYHYPGYDEALKAQIDKLMHTSNLYYNEPAARAAEKLGCTYITAGHGFATDCKKGLAPRGLDFLQAVCRAVDLPVWAIGGITPENFPSVRAAGARGGCVMSGLMTCADPAALLERFARRD